MDFKQELTALLGANVPLVHLVTYEEDRVIQTLSEIDGARRLGIVTWDLADGFVTVRPGEQPLPAKECTTDTLLPHLADMAPRGHIFVLKDFHHAWKQKPAFITRKLRNMVPKLRANSQYLLFTTPTAEVPLELKDDMVVLHVPLPDSDELQRVFHTMTAKMDRTKLPLPEVQDKLIGSALGLTSNQARLAFSRVWASYRKYDERGIDLVLSAKQEVIRESGALEFWPAQFGEADVAGLENLKSFLREQEVGFSADARAQGVPYPKGVALIGIPGTGKSLTAKMLSGLWKLPLLRLDVGALMNSLLGESEANARKAIMLAETVSPCILWIDEMEKAFAGSSGDGAAGGARAGVLGTFLTWMEERTTPVYIIATANDISDLRPELMGRFDATYFLDLPTETERGEIFRIHLKKAGEVDPVRQFRLDELVRGTAGYVGREIERIVRKAQFKALADGNREIEQGDLETAISQVVPLSRSHAEMIEAIRKWKTEGRAEPASSEPPPPVPERGRTIDI